jgi:hypothetical protein
VVAVAGGCGERPGQAVGKHDRLLGEAEHVGCETGEGQVGRDRPASGPLVDDNREPRRPVEDRQRMVDLGAADRGWRTGFHARCPRFGCHGFTEAERSGAPGSPRAIAYFGP